MTKEEAKNEIKKMRTDIISKLADPTIPEDEKRDLAGTMIGLKIAESFINKIDKI